MFSKMEGQNPGLYFSNQCRTCLNKSSDLQSLNSVAIVGSDQILSYGDLLKEVTSISIQDDKWMQMPQNICNCCSHQLKLSHNFMVQAIEANNHLWSLLPHDPDFDEKPCIEIKLESEEVVEQRWDEGAMQQSAFQVKTEFSEDDSLSEGCMAETQHIKSNLQTYETKQAFPFKEANESKSLRDSIQPKEEYKRKKYKVNNQVDRATIVNAALRGENWVSIASSLGINYKTAHHWVSSRRTESKPRGGKKTKKLTEDQVAILISWVEHDCNLTLEQLTSKIRNQFNISVSATTVGNYLDGRLYSCQRYTGLNLNVNSHEIKESRADYVRKLNQYILEGKQVAWMGEINFSLFCRTSRGRPRSKGFMEQLPAARGPNVSLIGAITSAGVLLLEQQRYALTFSSTTDWVCRILHKWFEERNNTGDLVIVCERLPCFSKIESAVAEQSAGKSTVLRSPSNSPTLNPIESIWTKVKSNVRTDFLTPNLREQSLQFLENAIDEALTTITDEDCARAVHQVSTVHADALLLNDI